MSEENKTPKEDGLISKEQSEEQLSIEELLEMSRQEKAKKPAEEAPVLEEASEAELSTDTEVIAPEELSSSAATANEDNKTRLFDTPQKPPKKKKEPRKKGKIALTVLKYTSKFTFKTALFVVRKALTYTLNVLLTAIIVGVLVGAVCVMAFMIYLNSYVNAEFTALDNLKYDSSLTTSLFYLDEHGNEVELADDRLSSSENRLWVPYDDIPKILVDAYVAIEDQRFWEHNGVDTKRTLSAVYNFFVPSGSNFGGSTLTQQLIKNVTGENDTTMQRKIQEIFRALDVEKKYDKTEIMEMYLNTIYLSQNCYGVRAAAETYFGKELSELTLNECAAIASIGKSPIKYDPILNPQYNLERRNLVLREMLAQGLITQEEFDEAYDAPLVFADDDEEDYGTTVHSYYVDAVIDDVMADLMETYGYDERTASIQLFSGGLQIVTCMDPNIQSIMEKVYTDESYWPASTGLQAQSAMCVMDPETGDLLGIVGGRGEKKTARGLNRATHSRRQCGSSIKPISVYALALETGLYNYAGPCDDVPVLYDETAEVHWPNNFNRVFDGSTYLAYAIKRSMNTVAADTCGQLGVDRVYKNIMEYGFTTLVDNYTSANGTVFSDAALSPLSLGSFTFGVTVREMTQAYACLANNGVTTKARTYSMVRDAMGNVILDNSNDSQTILYSEETAYMITRLMQNVISSSTGTGYRYIKFHKDFDGLEVVGKTGTTNDDKDLYFCGYTPDLVGACWYGYDNNKTITTGGGAAATLWDSVFRLIYEYYEAEGIRYKRTFDQPNTIAYAKDTGLRICTISGKLATEACEHDIAVVVDGESSVVTSDFYYIRSEAPTEYCDKHVSVQWDTVTKAICLPGCNCPQENLITVSFRLKTKEDRCFHSDLRIGDTQYILIPVPEGYEFPTKRSVPFFINLYSQEEGKEEYPGHTSGATYPYNRFCKEHASPVVLPPVIDVGGTP